MVYRLGRNIVYYRLLNLRLSNHRSSMKPLSESSTVRDKGKKRRRKGEQRTYHLKKSLVEPGPLLNFYLRNMTLITSSFYSSSSQGLSSSSTDG